MLIKLNVSFCPKVNSHVLLPDKIWTSNVPLKLREISLSGNNNITSEVVFRIIKLCCCLQSFELASCPSIQSFDTASNKQGISNTRSECVQKPQKTDHSHMKSVNFVGSLNVEDSVIIALSYICPDLRNLRLTDCKKLTKNVLGVVFRNCRFIDSLEIANCTFKEKNIKIL
ncbi:FBXL1 [Mytilus edulis]|uniref:SKP2 n=1 Tax=Mytilus edulis TaxID=6550 RepID=A0A8S3SX61_MYTED|nr:FBXL1 [Mytilus edulis]